MKNQSKAYKILTIILWITLGLSIIWFFVWFSRLPTFAMTSPPVIIGGLLGAFIIPIIILIVRFIVGKSTGIIPNQRTSSNPQNINNLDKTKERNDLDELAQLQKLLDLNVINAEEFEDKKKKVAEKRIREEIEKKRTLELERAKENFKKREEERQIARNTLKSLRDSGILTQREYETKIEDLSRAEKIDSQSKNADKIVQPKKNSDELRDSRVLKQTNDKVGLDEMYRDIVNAFNELH